MDEESNLNEDITFDEWFDIFLDEVKSINWAGPVDKYTFEDDYERGNTPEAAAREFVAEMQAP